MGNPNAGKTTLFNALTGLRAKTANFPGTTVERKVGRLHLDHKQIVVVDLPGLYSLDSKSPDEKLASDALQGRLEHTAPDAALVVVDATNLERNLFLASQVLELKCPVWWRSNMMDMARRDGIRIDVAKLRQELGCVVVPVSARTGDGVAAIEARVKPARQWRHARGGGPCGPALRRLHRLHLPGALRMDRANFRPGSWTRSLWNARSGQTSWTTISRIPSSGWWYFMWSCSACLR